MRRRFRLSGVRVERRRPRRGQAEPLIARLSVTDGVGRFRINRNLQTPNADRNAHWTVKHAERSAWERAIECAIQSAAAAAQSFRQVVASAYTAPHRRAPRRRFRVEVHRVVPSRRNFIKDDDNLRFSVKPLNDALKRVGLIYDDRREWLEAADADAARLA